MMNNQISVVVPVLNERQNLPKLLEQLGHFSFAQIIIVDGGSADESWQYLSQFQETSSLVGLEIVQSESGRAKQMNAGAAIASAEVILFLHADTELPNNAIEKIFTSIATADWGRFDVVFKEHDWRMKIIAQFMNLRSRMTGVATGDQAMFMRRQVFEELHGFANIPLMEDVNLSKRLLKHSRPICLKVQVITSARRWLKHGVLRTVLLMWWLRFAYFIGVNPEKLAKKYQVTR